MSAGTWRDYYGSHECPICHRTSYWCNGHPTAPATWSPAADARASGWSGTEQAVTS